MQLFTTPKEYIRHTQTRLTCGWVKKVYGDEGLRIFKAQNKILKATHKANLAILKETTNQIKKGL